MIHLWQWFWIWFATHSGTYNESGPYYGFFSGIGSDLGEIVLIGGVIQLYRKHNCHVAKCPWIAHHKFTDVTEGTEYLLCKKHYREVHPEVPKLISLEHLLHVHKKNKLYAKNISKGAKK